MNDIPYIAHEAIMARMERIIKRLTIIIILLIILLCGTNAAWIYYESQFETVSTSVSQEAYSDTGDATIYGDKAGAIIYGIEDEADNNSENS